MGQEEKQMMNDHDLLIRLDTKLESFSQQHTTMFASFNDAIHRFFSEVKTKADKDEFLELKKSHEELKGLVSKHDTFLEVGTAKKQTVITIGEWGVKGWTILIATVGLIITVVRALK